MAYSAVPTKNTGDTWSAADNNTYIRDNMAAMPPDVFTTKGDLFVATGADAGARLAAGTNGNALTADSTQTTGVKWASVSGIATAYARYKIGAAQNVSNTTATIINYGTLVYDPDTAVTTGAAWKYTVPTDKGGYYLVMATVYLTADTDWSPAEGAQLWLYKNNSAFTLLSTTYAQASAASTAFSLFVTGATLISLSAADYIDARLYQDSGGTIEVNASGDYSHISIARLY